LTDGGISGIINAGRITRLWVEDDQHGFPFLSSTDILQADLSNISHIAKSVARQNSQLLIKDRWTLITRSGTIGRMAYARADMNGMACTEDVLRVIPDEEKVKPGYIYAYLCTKFGVPLVISGTYGSIITHLEPHHIADLPVPRLGAVEDQAHELIQSAADLRVEAAVLLKTAGQIVNDQFGFPEKLALSHRAFSCSTASSTLVLKRLEATFHDAVAQESDRLIAGVPRKDEFSTLGIAISETGRLKQVFVDEEHGAPFLTSGEIFRQRYEPTRFLSNRLLPDESEWATQEGDLLLARSGQVGGIIGRGVWADRRFAGGCVSVDVLRLGAQNSQILPGYLYAYMFLTDVGYRQLIRTAAGSSIPHLSAPDVSRRLIPRCDSALEAEINELVWNAGHKRSEAQEKEDQARTLVERTIEEGGR
ncbi:MAG: restriction endonuclease subunit S, partial [Candidatus Thiodiazotropha taylori]|nr:restriction endonuclease subunit S [Candidatus Thiodiazotropha taylori]MCW4336464.1 restriction endonuclease subunit S [Candidatus Thiodiazotropha endolucinida]MCG8034688.1 restriction endonuclease subunit S [Candidatus Thiodiazotropha taylori]MCG8113666.1 restriction endonuclease subunit S [Candidatus Thiodiazotropha taylori]MCW4286026.1 restriction endonuclease subunit S [Candidatus Thiodiazotropha taylori]